MQNNANKRQISFDEVQKFAKDKGCLSMEGSALSGKNVNEMFEQVIRKYVESNGDLAGGDSNGNKSKQENVKLDKAKETPQKKGCC